MPLLPQAFLPEKAAGWSAAIHFAIAGADAYTLIVKDGKASIAPGKGDALTCTVQLDAETIVGMLDGSVKGEQAFMAGKIKADNLGDMMKFGKAFKIDPAQVKAALAGGAAPPAAAAGPAPGAPGADLPALFRNLPSAFLAEKAGGWNGRIAFEAAGQAFTVEVKDRQASVHDGRAGDLTATVTAEAAVLAAFLTGRPDAKVQASNAAALVKFRQMFRLSPDLAPKATAAAPAPQGANRARIGHVYAGPATFARPEWIRAYALATNDENPAYLDPARGIVAPPVFPVRLVRDLLFEAMTDRELNLDLLRLVHGEQDMTFHRHIRPWDLLTPRATLLSIDDKESGQIVTMGVNLFREGLLATEMRIAFFIRGEKKEGGKDAPKPPEADRGKPALQHVMKVSDDQPLRYADASGDHNPIHTDPAVAVARSAGLPGIILQGLCTMAFTSQAVIRTVAGSDPLRLHRLAVRFSKPVLPGDTLTTSIWPGADPGQHVFETVNQDGARVITNGLAVLP
jgi:acyl dehydratase/putative sterol carrier protein